MGARRVLAIAAVVLTAGCGSTVQVGRNGTGVSTDSLSVPSAGPGTTSGAAPGATTTGGTSGTGSAAGGGSITGTSSSTTGGGSIPGGTNSAANGPGITPTTIYVGESYDPNIAAADAALGAASASPGDAKAETEAVIHYINQHGGIAGRKVVAVWHRISSSDSASTSAEATCQAWTQDHKVFVLNGGNFRGAGTLMDECAKRAGGIHLIPAQITTGTTAMAAQYPADFNLHGFTNDRAMRYTIAGLSDLGYFSGKPRVGIVTWDDPNFHYGITHAAVPALAQLGLHNVPVQYVASPSSYGDLGATSASVSSAVLRFNGRVDHVIIFDGASGVAGGGILTLQWMNQAESQHYRPKYGLNSTSGFNALAGDLPAKQLANSVGVGWEPALEQTSDDFTAMTKAADAKLCQQIMDRAGQHGTSANGIALQYMACDYYFLLKQALDSIHGPVNQATAIAAFNAIGARHHSIVNFAARVDARHHDLPYLVRNMTYQSSCSCFRYVGRTYNPAD